MKLTALGKVKYNDRVVGLLCTSGSIKSVIPKLNFMTHDYENIQITKDLKVVGDIPDIAESNLNDFNLIKLYHASHTGINGNIVYTASRQNCDFGLGFYTGDYDLQAKSIVATDTNPYFYTFYVCLSDLKVYTFTDDIIWALYVGVNRGFISLQDYPKLSSLVRNINSYDIIKGLIADDRMYYVYSNFVDGNITDKVLVEALKYVKLGYQYVFKNQKACNYLTCVDYYSIPSVELKQLRKSKSSVLGKLQNNIEAVIKRYRHDSSGKYIDEILEVYK